MHLFLSNWKILFHLFRIFRISVFRIFAFHNFQIPEIYIFVKFIWNEKLEFHKLFSFEMKNFRNAKFAKFAIRKFSQKLYRPQMNRKLNDLVINPLMPKRWRYEEQILFFFTKWCMLLNFNCSYKRIVISYPYIE